MADKGRRGGEKKKGEEGRGRDKWSEDEKRAENIRNERKKKEREVEKLKEEIKNLKKQEDKLRDKVQRLKDEEDRRLGRQFRKMKPYLQKLMKRG